MVQSTPAHHHRLRNHGSTVLVPLLLLLSHLAQAQNSAIEASVADRNEEFQQFNPSISQPNEPAVQLSTMQRPPPPTRPEFVGGTETSTSLTVRWKGAWAPSVSNYPVNAFEVQFRGVGAPTWTTATSFEGGAMDINRFHHEIQTVTTRANVGQYIDSGWFRLSMHARGMNDKDPESKTQSVRIAFNASATDFKAALEALDNVRFAGTTKHVTRSNTPDAQGGFTWTVSFDVGPLDLHDTAAAAHGGDDTRNWPALLVTETYFPGAAWTGGGRHVNVGTARVGSGASSGGAGRGAGRGTGAEGGHVSMGSMGFNGDLHDAHAGLAACAHAGHLGDSSGKSGPGGTHAGVAGPSYDQLRMAYPPSYCQLVVAGLQQYSSYQLRIRARNVHGWGVYSDVTDPIGRTKRGTTPSKPMAPTLTSLSGQGKWRKGGGCVVVDGGWWMVVDVWWWWWWWWTCGGGGWCLWWCLGWY